MIQRNELMQIQKKASYELSIEIYDKSVEEIRKVLLRHSQGIADYTNVYQDGTIGICKIAASTGAINRDDAAFFQLQPINNGYRCVAYVIYKPSVMYWIFLLLLLGTWVLWVIPIVFYYSQKNTVRNAIQNLLQQVKREVEEKSQTAIHSGDIQ